MTIADARTQARRYARVDTTGASDARVNSLIQDAVNQFSHDVGGFSMEKYPVIAATFDTDTHFAIRVTIVGGTNEMAATDVVITSTARSGTTGTVVAADFQTALRAAIGVDSITVAYTDFAFTIDTIDATSITYEEPTDVNYADARGLLGLFGTPTLSDYSHTGDFPEDCTVEYTLPTDMMSVERVEWDGKELWQAPREAAMSPEVSGTPQWYHIRGRTLHLIPSPNSQGLCKVWYRGMPADLDFSGYQECGLTGVSDEKATGLAATTAYYFKVAINGGASTEYTITTAADTTYSAVITLMNAQVSGAAFSIVAGDLRCTSDAIDGVSTIALAAGTTATNLFATLTGFSAFETAVSGDTDLPSEIPAMYHQAIPFFVAYMLLLEQFDDDMSAQRYALYLKTMRQFRLTRAVRNTTPDDNDYRRWGIRYTVSM